MVFVSLCAAHLTLPLSCPFLVPLLLAGCCVGVALWWRCCGVRRLTAYCTSKAAMIAFSESLRAECGKNRVGVSAVCPGFVATPFFGQFSRDPGRHAVPNPPRWICTTPEKVARKVVKAIRKNRRVVLATPLAYLLYYVRRIAPGLLIGVQRLSRKNKRPKTESAATASDQRKAA